MSSLIGHVRDAARVPMIGAGGGGLGGVFRDPGSSELDAMSAVGTMFSIVSTLTTATAGIEWGLFRKRTPREDHDSPRKPVARHAALDLWNRPNPFMHRQELVEAGQQHHELLGECTLLVVRDPRSPIPLELWPVRPDRLQEVPSRTQFLAGWVYTAPDGEKVPLGVDDILHVKSPNPKSLYRGLGPVSSIRWDVESAMYSARWNAQFFRNSAVPGGVIQAPGRLGEAEFRRLQSQWREEHRGVRNSHRVAILEGGVEWKDTAISQRDMQFVEMKGVTSDAMREAFGVSKTMLGLTENVNRASAQVAEQVFGKWRVSQRLQRWKNALNFRLLPMFGPAGDGVEFDYLPFLPEDEEAENAERQSKVNAAYQLVMAGYDPAQVTAAMELPDMDWVGLPGPAGGGQAGGAGAQPPGGGSIAYPAQA